MHDNFPQTRFNHCYMVGTVMKYVAENFYNYDENKSNDMFMIGYLHDMMYDYEENETLHNEIMSKYMPTEYSKDVLHHSTYQSEYKSDALDMLYFADQIVDGNGVICNFEDRIADILNRHGKDDGVYQDTIDIVNYLNSVPKLANLETVVCSNETLKNTNIPLDEMQTAWELSTYNKKISSIKYLYNLMEQSNDYVFNDSQKLSADKFKESIKEHLVKSKELEYEI